MPAQVIKIQSYRDYQAGLITGKEVLEGKIFNQSHYYERLKKFNSFDLFGWVEKTKTKIDWSKVAHNPLCCCGKCAPTEEDRKKKIEMHLERLKEE